MKKLLVVVALSLLAGCSQNPFSRWNSSFGPTFPQSADGQAALYIVREAAPPEAPPIILTLGQQSLSGLRGANYMRLDLDPRLYDLRAYGTAANSELIITVAPGQTRFLLARTAGADSAELLELSPEQGRQLVRQAELVYVPPLY
ncbi:hypothetical protein BH11PSE3_BH11PSE3_30820 [soil metagenome]